MPSPISCEEFKKVVRSTKSLQCDGLQRILIQLPNTWYQFFTYLYNEDGTFTDEFSADVCVAPCEQIQPTTSTTDPVDGCDIPCPSGFVASRTDVQDAATWNASTCMWELDYAQFFPKVEDTQPAGLYYNTQLPGDAVIIGPFAEDVDVYALDDVAADDYVVIDGVNHQTGGILETLPIHAGEYIDTILAGNTMEINVRNVGPSPIGITVGDVRRIGVKCPAYYYY